VVTAIFGENKGLNKQTTGDTEEHRVMDLHTLCVGVLLFRYNLLTSSCHHELTAARIWILGPGWPLLFTAMFIAAYPE